MFSKSFLPTLAIALSLSSTLALPTSLVSRDTQQCTDQINQCRNHHGVTNEQCFQQASQCCEQSSNTCRTKPGADVHACDVQRDQCYHDAGIPIHQGYQDHQNNQGYQHNQNNQNHHNNWTRAAADSHCTIQVNQCRGQHGANIDQCTQQASQCCEQESNQCRAAANANIGVCDTQKDQCYRDAGLQGAWDHHDNRQNYQQNHQENY